MTGFLQPGRFVPPPPPLTILATTSGTGASSTTTTVTLPSHTDSDYIVLVVTRNQTSTSWAGSSGASITELADVGTRRLSLLRVNQAPSATTFVLTASGAALFGWCCMVLSGTPSGLASVSNDDLGSNTTSPISFYPLTVPPTTGGELLIAACGTNSTATWTDPASPSGLTRRAGLTAAPGLLVVTGAPAASLTSITVGDADRALSGTARYETSMAVCLRP